MRFTTTENSDKRIKYASKYLINHGFEKVNKTDSADFILLGVNPDLSNINSNLPILAGNVSAPNVYDYTKLESFAVKNAYLTAEGALSILINNSEHSLINSSVLITGYGRIAKALHLYLKPFTANITVCARKPEQRVLAEMYGAKTTVFNKLKESNTYNYIINTVPHPAFNEKELSVINKDTLMIDLASFPGGIDIHFSKVFGLNLITARGLPAKYSPQAAGEAVGEAVIQIIREVII